MTENNEKSGRFISAFALDELDDVQEALQGVAGVLCNLSVSKEAGGGHMWDNRSLMMLCDVVTQQVSKLEKVQGMVLEAPETASKAS